MNTAPGAAARVGHRVQSTIAEHFDRQSHIAAGVGAEKWLDGHTGGSAICRINIASGLDLMQRTVLDLAPAAK